VGAIDDNGAAREAILARVRAALGKTGDRAAAVAGATAYLAERRQGPRPAMPGDLVERFLRRATDMESTVERLPSLAQLPAAVARYVDALDLDPSLAEQKSHRGVCWPEFGALDWAAAGLTIEPRATVGHDRLGITGTFCAVAETGTLVVATGAGAPTASMLLPDTHVAVVRADRVVAGMEDAFALIRAERATMPRGVHFVSGPSRTGDIEQTIVVGAHGPFRVHIIVVDG
jgi:L-lactate dehydrogenase complex protein LldG